MPLKTFQVRNECEKTWTRVSGVTDMRDAVTEHAYQTLYNTSEDAIMYFYVRAPKSKRSTRFIVQTDVSYTVKKG